MPSIGVQNLKEIKAWKGRALKLFGVKKKKKKKIGQYSGARILQTTDPISLKFGCVCV